MKAELIFEGNRRGVPSDIEGSLLELVVFCRFLLAKNWPSTEQFCITYKNCELKGNRVRDSVSATKCIVLVSDRSISCIYWSGFNCVKFVCIYYKYIFIVCVYVCIYTHTHKF